MLVAIAGVGVIVVLPAQPNPMVTLPDVNTAPRPASRVPIYYPPAPPPPGGEIDPAAHLLEPNWDAPEGLDAYLGELFYPVVGSRLAERSFPRRQRSRLEAYVAKRTALVESLRTALTVKEPLSPDDAEAIEGLESEADELRRDLIDDDFAWGRYRGWRVGPKQLEEDENLVRVREFHVLRANSFYYAGTLSTAQRWLLWDYVLQIEAVGEIDKVEAPSIRPGGLLRFLPAGSQIRLPRKLSDDVREAMVAFVDAKTAIQRELADKVVRLDEVISREYWDEYEALGQRQQAQIAELESMAESIRERLAALPAEDPIVLPEPLATQARHFRGSREALQMGLASALSEVRAKMLRYRPGSEALIWKANFRSGAIVPRSSIGPETKFEAVWADTPPQQARAARARERLDEAWETHQQATAAQREEVTQAGGQLFFAALKMFFPETPVDQPIPAEVATKLLAVLALNEESERMHRYETYVTATTRPGLTPAQRRLLFGAALRELSLPLPPGIRRPINDMTAP